MNIPALLDDLSRRYPGTQPRLIETHISWVLIAGEFAYKIKKPVKFAFVDFLTLDRRKYFCEEEIRLNQRFAPDIYLGIAPITLSATNNEWAIDPASTPAPNEIVEWAVKMKAFEADATLDHAATIEPNQMDAIADRIAHFHQSEPPIPADSPLGSAAEVARIARENLTELAAMLPEDQRVQALQQWTEAEINRLSPLFTERKQKGSVKDGHGDLHLGNIAWVNDQPLIFDCIEFSDTLRCIDVISEIAFLFMDLCARNHRPLAWRMINRWLEHTGDYAGVVTLPFYAAYRALVRAKISLHQKKSDDANLYLTLAKEFSSPPVPTLMLMHGFSGSGKTYASQRILESKGMIRLRSDVERKRLHGLTAQESSRSELNTALYQKQATEDTFHHLEQQAARLLRAGFGVIVDATFLRHLLRERFIALAAQHGVSATIMDADVAPEICRERILQRQQFEKDASEATLDVLAHQLQSADPLTHEEMGITQKVSEVLSEKPGV